MNRFIMIAMFLLTATITNGQKIAVPTLTHGEVSNFVKSLNTRIADTIRVDILLQLAAYNILKEGKYKANLDSAAAFIQQAYDLNATIKSPKLDGCITLVKSRLAKKGGDTMTGKELVNRSIRLLESADDAFHLSLAYLDFLSYGDIKNPDHLAEVNGLMPAVLFQLRKIKNPVQRSDCIQTIMHFYQTTLNELDLVKKLSFLADLHKACRTIRDGPSEVWVRKEIADIHLKQGKTKEAESELLELLKFQKTLGYPHICFTYDLLAKVYVDMSDNNTALYYALETIKSISSPLDSSYLPDFYVRLAGVYNNLGHYDQVYYWSMKTIDYQRVTGRTDIFYYDACDLIIRYLIIRINKPEQALKFILDTKKYYSPISVDQKKYLALCMARCHQALKNNLLVEKYCQEIVNLYDTEKSPLDIPALQFIADYYLNTKQYTKAKKYLNIALNTFPSSAGVSRDLFESRFMYELSSATGNYQSALVHLRRNNYLGDSILNAYKNKQIEELRISYEMDLKEDSIRLKDKDISLLKQENDLQQANLQQSAFVKKVTIAGIILAFVIIVLLYRQYRLKQRSNNAITHKNEQLQHLLTEKEWLLKEIHHRVKNNLQIVMSLLNSQSAYINNDAALTAIHDSQHRVHAMSLIHQKLYSSENVSSINMSVYIRELVSYLSESFDAGKRIRFELNIDPLKMDVSQAVPLGLILNEAITNSIKYAFPDKRNGIISISLVETRANHYSLSISDNGIGIPAEFKKTGSLGMSLMKGLSEDIDGNFSVENSNGTVIKISFVHYTVMKTHDSFSASFISTN